MDSLQSLLPKVLRRRGLQGQATASLVVHRAQDWLRSRLPEFAAELEVKKVQDGVLVIACRHSIASQECHGLSADLLRALQSEFPAQAPRELRLIRADGRVSE